MSRVKFTDRQQADLTEMQALADSAEDNAFALVNALLFSSDYRVEGGLVAPDGPPSGIVTIDPGVFVKADGKFYKMATEATANILTGVENQSANVWGTGLAADPALPRKDIIVVSHQFVESDVQVKNFIDDSVTPPVQFTQNVTTRKNSTPLFAVLHGTPSATPSEPAIPSGFMKIATIDVPAAATTILVGNITNNLNIDIKSLEKLQQASQAQAAFSDLLHSDGVYSGVLNALGVSETTPQTMGVSVATGVALKDGVTARVSTATTVPIDAASFFPIVAENVTFNVDTKTLNANGTPPHKIRAGTVVVPTKTEGVDYTVDYNLGTITRLGGGSIPALGSITVSYDYYLPRIDRIEVLVSNSTPQSITGTPAQVPVAPVASPNAITLALVTVAEGVTTIVNANISDQRVYLPTMDELVAARGIFASLSARLADQEADISAVVAAEAAHEADNITSGNTVHGIRQGSGNGLDADTVDGDHAATLKARANHTGTQAPATISPQGPGSTLDADTVDGIHAATTPQANKLLALDVSAQFPSSVFPPSVAFPAGIVLPYFGITEPTGWIFTNGRSLLRVGIEAASWGTFDSALLFAVIGDRNGAADASHYNIPDTTGAFLRGIAGISIVDKTFAPAAVNTGTDQVTIPGHGYYTGLPVKFDSTGSRPAGIDGRIWSPSSGSDSSANRTTYYVIVVDANNIRLALTRTLALAGTFIDITSTGSGSHTVRPMLDPDSALREAARFGGATGPNVGAVQEGSNAVHGHTELGKVNNFADGEGGGGATPGSDTVFNSGIDGGYESRPRNIGCNYIIKV